MTQPNTQLYKPSIAEIPECFDVVFRNSLEDSAASMLDTEGLALYERGFRPQLEDEKHYWVRVARQVGRLSLVFVGTRWLPQYDNVNYVDSFFVIPEARGTRPVRDVMNAYRQEFADPLLPIRMHTALVNRPVRLLADKLGYDEVPQPVQHGDGLPMSLWERAPELTITEPSIEDAATIFNLVENEPSQRFYQIIKNAQKTIVAGVNGAKKPTGTMLEDLFVDESCRGKGVGSHLCDLFMRWADHDKSIYLEVAADNQRLIDFYHKKGFVKTSENSHKYIVPRVVMTYQGETQ